MPLYLDKLTVTAGFLENAVVEFSPGLTCIIGARGTCKSTIVETLRFAFDRDRSRIADLLGASENRGSPSFGLIRSTLTGTAKVAARTVEASTTRTVTIERDAVPTVPRVYADGVMAVEGVPPFIEIYSQAELQLIAADPARRLDLVDRRIADTISSLRTARTQLASRLTQSGNTLRAIQVSVEGLASQVQSLPTYKQQLKEMIARRPQLATDLQVEHEKTLLREQTLELAKRAVGHYSTVADEVVAVSSRAALSKDWIAALLSTDLDGARDLHNLLTRFSAEVVATAQAAQTTKSDFHGALRRMSASAAAISAPYLKMRQEREAVNESLKMEGRLTEEIRKLEGIQARIDEMEKQRRAALEERADIRAQIAAINDQIFTLRSKEIVEINEENYSRVILTLKQGAHSGEFTNALNKMLEGSRLRNQNEIASGLARAVTPAQLVDIIEQRDATRLATLLGKDQAQSARLISFLSDVPDLYALETILFEDELEITLFDQGVPKPLAQLSKGQMATALLPLILREAPYPLVFDQPEDDLDNRFIFEQLVEAIRALKVKRQLIFVTHNANIPVLGDADRIIVMQMANSIRARPPVTGSLEDNKAEILALLEGGAQAFRRRSERYGGLVA